MTKSASKNIPLIRGSKRRGVRKIAKVSIFSLELVFYFGLNQVLKEQMKIIIN